MKKYCNNNDCVWNNKNGLCTYFELDDDEEMVPETRECKKKKSEESEE